MKKSQLLKTLTIALFLMTGVGNAWGQVIISQYYEGASNDKWIEITNIGTTSVDLSSPQQYLCLFSNAAADDPANNTPTNNETLTGTIAAGEVILFKNSSAVLPNYASGTSSSACNFNGDDLIIISTSNDASAWADRSDVIGNGTSWGENTSYYRNSNITSGNTTYSTSEWTEVTNSTVNNATSGNTEYLGTHVYSSGSSPTITLSTSTLTGFTYLVGNGPSSEQSFTVEGSNLTNDITVTAPTNYEISTGTGGSFVPTSPITLAQSGGSVTTTTIYVRLKAGLAIGSYNDEEITASSTGAASKTIICSGSVTDPNVNVEDFANYPVIGSSYASGTFLGQDGSTWTYTECRGDQLITDETPCLRNTSESNLYSGTISGGIGTINFDYMQAFSSNVDLNVLVNDIVVGNVTSSSQQGVVLSSGDITINVAGDFVLKFAQNSSGGQVAIDNVSWTPFEGNILPNITNITQNPASNITSSTTVEVSAEVTDPDGTIASVNLKWGTSSGDYSGGTISMTNGGSGDVYTTSSYIPAQANGTTVYYIIEATDNETATATSAEQSYLVTDPVSEPTNHPTAFQATANSSSAITVSWTDSDAASYLIKGSSVGFGDIAAPVDGTPEDNGALVQNVSAGLHSHQFTGLDAETTYYFKIFPYNGLETTINYKVDGAPQDDATTLEGIDFIVIDFDNADNWIAGAVSLSSYAIDHNYVDGVFSATGGEALRNGTSTQDGFPGALGTYSWRLRDNTSVEWTITIASGGVGLFEVDVRRWDGSPSPDYNLDYSVDGGNNWTNITTINNTSLDNSSDWKTFTGTINHTASNIMIRFIANGSTERIMIDNFKWTAFVGEAATNWLADAGSSNWNDPNNWSNGLPGIVSDVVINSGTNDPLLQSGYTIQSLNISSGAKLNIGTSGQLSVTGTLTNNAGTTGLYIHSAANGTGSLIHNTDNVPFTIERYVSGGQNAGGGTSPYKYHLISIPLAGDIQAGDVFTGTYLWHFVPNQTGENAWSGITSLTENLDNQKGFLSYVEETENTFTFTGTMNNGSFSVAAENIDAGNVKLIPNPYPSAIDWEAVDLTGTGLNPTIWLFNSNTGNYESYNAGVGAGQRYIPVGQAVFAEAATANPTLTFTNAHRTHNQGNGFYKSGNETIADMIKIAVSANNSSDATFIRFREQADNTYNGFDDASKLKGFSGAPQLYTYSTDNRALSINTLATSQETMIVPLAFELEVSAEAVMSFEYLETFEPTVQIFLEDLLTNQMVDLRENSNYTFSHEASHDPDRFKLHFMGVTSLDEQLATADHFRVWTNENQLYVLPTDELTKGQLQIELFDLSGRLIQSINQQVQKPMILSLPDYEGIMLVRIQNEKLVQTNKIFIR